MRKVIVLEGPDWAGKTTLAEQIAIEAQATGRSVTINHSPAGASMKWLPEWDTWTEDALERFDGHLVILDRTPELSEIVYGQDRARPRMQSVTRSINSVNGSSAVVIFCLPVPYTPQGKHHDAAGTEIKINRLYEHYKRYEVLHWMTYWSPPLSSTIIRHNWKSPPSVNILNERVQEWLT